jgi:hypothetical protein
MNELTVIFAAAAELEGLLRAKGWRFCFIGGLAVQRWGAPRFTQDVDLTLFTGVGGESEYVDILLQNFTGRVRNARQVALEHRVVLLRNAHQVDFDISLGALPWEETSISRATKWQVHAALALTTCSAEDLVVHKVFAGRDRDWGDVEGILIRQHGRLKVAQIRGDLVPLLEMKEDAEALAKFEGLVEKVDGRMK